MYRSESLINDLLMEVDSLSNRVTNILQAYSNTSHLGLRERLFDENNSIYQRLNEILTIAKKFKIKSNSQISFSSLLVERCERIINKTRKEKNLFFL